MAASNKTVNKICAVLIKHLPRWQALAILDDLCQIEGNKSFVETVKAVREKLKILNSVLDE